MPSQNCPFFGGNPGPHQKRGSLHGPTRGTRVHTSNGTLIGSAVFVGLAVVTNRKTDRQTTLQR